MVGLWACIEILTTAAWVLEVIEPGTGRERGAMRRGSFAGMGPADEPPSAGWSRTRAPPPARVGAPKPYSHALRLRPGVKLPMCGG